MSRNPFEERVDEKQNKDGGDGAEDQEHPAAVAELVVIEDGKVNKVEMFIAVHGDEDVLVLYLVNLFDVGLLATEWLENHLFRSSFYLL